MAVRSRQVAELVQRAAAARAARSAAVGEAAAVTEAVPVARAGAAASTDRCAASGRKAPIAGTLRLSPSGGRCAPEGELQRLGKKTPVPVSATSNEAATRGTPPPQPIRSDMKLCRLVASFIALILLAGCARQPAPDQLFSPTQLSNLVTDRTLYVPFSSYTMPLFYSDTPNGMLLYLARDGTGWLDSRLVSGSPPTPSGMSMVFNWRVVDGSQVCLWASPLIGVMPSFAPAFQVCVQVLRSGMPPDRLEAKITQDGKSRLGTLELYPFNAFSLPVIDEYLTRVGVLYGGQIPTWTLR